MKTKDLNWFKIIKNNLHMVGEVYRADAGYIWFSVFVRLLSGVRTSFLYVYLLGNVLKAVENKRELGEILLFLLCGTIFLAGAFVVDVYYKYIFQPVHKEQIINLLQHNLFDKLQHADMENYDSTELYTMVTLANEEIATRPLAVTDNLFRGFECIIATCFIIAATVPANWFVFAICMLSFGIGLIFTNVRSKKAVQYDEEMRIMDKTVSLLFRLLYLPEYEKENRLSKVHDTFLNEYKATVEKKKKIAVRSGKKIANLAFFQQVFCDAFCIDFVIPLCLSIIVLLFGKLSVSEFVIAINAGAQIQLKLDDLIKALLEMLKNGNFVQRLRNVEKIKCEIEDAEGCRTLERMNKLSVNSLDFCYPDGTMGVSDIHLSIEKGSKVAIVGRNGSGKTTLLKLLLRFYDPMSGSITLNGVDIRDLNTQAYRSQFGVAFQNFNIYAASVRDNVCMGNDVNEERLIDALIRAGLSELSNKLDTVLTRELDNDGILLSGGLLQRLILARVFYEDNEIVIMDEPTAAMDVFFEREFFNTIFTQLKEKTIIFVSHRLSAVTACDKIVYMESGKIIEEGTHDELMKMHGRYYALFNAQFE